MNAHDYIIIGAGSAGCVLAARLTEDPRVRVLLLEAGPQDRRREIAIPAAFPKLFRSDVDWAYWTAPQDGLGGRSVFFPRGRTLGGSSSINAQMYVRGHPADYDWGPGWDYAGVLPYFRRAEDNARGADALHGAGGPLRVEDQRDPSPLSRAFVDAARQIASTGDDRVDGPSLDQAELVQVTQRRGRRWSAADGWLRPALERPNLEVLTGAHARRIVLDGPRAAGVAFDHRGERRIARATREVLACAGAINSPQLLMLSGIGPAEHLAAHGIDVVRHLPGVGQNLQDHLGAPVMCASTKPVSLAAAETPRQLARYLLRRRGMLTSNVGEAVAFARTHPALEAPDLELVFGPVLYVAEGLEPPPAHGFTLVPVALRPRSRGQVALRSADPYDAPAIQPNYLSDPDGEDLRVLVSGVRLARRIARARALASLAGAELAPGTEARRDEDIEAWLRGAAHTIYHPVGTCRMGDDATAVVDHELRVRGVEGLRVVDASVIPRIMRGHPHAAVTMLAEKAADLIREAGPTPALVPELVASAR